MRNGSSPARPAAKKLRDSVKPKTSRKRSSTPEESARLLAPLRRFADAGGNINELARLAHLPKATLHGWLTRGLPMPVVDYDRVMRLLRKE